MKLTKKLRYLFSLTSLLVCLCMGSVGVNAELTYDDLYGVEEETTTSAEDAKTYAGGRITLGDAKSLAEQYVSALSPYASCSKEELEYIANATSGQTDIYANFAKIAGDDGCGAFSTYDNVEVTETEEENQVEITAVMHFDKKDIKMVLNVTCFDTIGTQVTSTEFSLADEGGQTIGEKMMEASSNTLVGMGVVFCVLIFISLIISCFGFIPKITEKLESKKNKKKKVQEETSVEISAETVVTEDNKEDTELIAVIAAAIAASEQTSTDRFVVRSIRKH